jgi:hypothetical protein
MGLKIYARLAEREYGTAREVKDNRLAAVNITRDTFHGD